jgi:5-methylcytosine-specific restriction endonuclease McrA
MQTDIKNVTTTTQEKKSIRVCSKTWTFDVDTLDQLAILQNDQDDPLYKIPFYKEMLHQISIKRSSYIQQDKKKGRYIEDQFISIEDILAQLKEHGLTCYYCKDAIFILYDVAREKKQWSVDRIDNHLGHNRGNIRISCLQCNLKKRRTDDERFRFTKQLVVVKTGVSESESTNPQLAYLT